MYLSYRGTACTVAENSPSADKNYALETYGAKSKCVEHGRHWIAKNGWLLFSLAVWSPKNIAISKKVPSSTINKSGNSLTPYSH